MRLLSFLIFLLKQSLLSSKWAWGGLMETKTGIDSECWKDESEACVYIEESKDSFPSNWQMSENFVQAVTSL